jgi:NADH:ubiquinone oxidoreductase subunit 2 (subunit N)
VATTLGAFTVASWVERKGDECQNVDDWAGLARRRPHYYYLRIVTAMYFREGQGGVAYRSWASAVVLVLLAVLVLGLGIVPAPLMTLVQ